MNNEYRPSTLPREFFSEKKFNFMKSSFQRDVPTSYSSINNPINDSCSICLDNFRGNDKVRRINCSHIFHIECLDKWTREKKACPLCKKDIV